MKKKLKALFLFAVVGKKIGTFLLIAVGFSFFLGTFFYSMSPTTIEGAFRFSVLAVILFRHVLVFAVDRLNKSTIGACLHFAVGVFNFFVLLFTVVVDFCFVRHLFKL